MIFIKKYIAFLTALFLFISGNIVCVNAGADIAVGITINGKVIETDVSPFVENGRTLVPVRAVSEHLKYSVEWFAEEQRVDIDSPSDKLTLYIGNADYYKNGEKRTMDVPAVIKDERTFVPLRLVAEELGCEVKWDEENNIALNQLPKARVTSACAMARFDENRQTIAWASALLLFPKIK